MPNPRKLDRRRRSIRNIRKITRTMELIANARFKRAMDRTTAATSFTTMITRLVSDLAHAGLEVSHPLLDDRQDPKTATLLLLTANRGMCGGYNGNLLRLGATRYHELTRQIGSLQVEISGRRGLTAARFRKWPVATSYTQFEDRPRYEEVEPLANRYLEAYLQGSLDRLDVVYTKFLNPARQTAVVETLLPLGSLAEFDEGIATLSVSGATVETMYEFLPSAEAILDEVVPISFKVRLFKCFLDAAVSEQIARRVAMKAATENADAMIKHLSRTYNRARQSRITNEIMEVIGGAEALNG